MKPNNENKIKANKFQKSACYNVYNKLVDDLERFMPALKEQKDKRSFKYNKINELSYQKRNRLIMKYRICQNKKYRILREGNYYPDIALELMDRFRGILNSMLEDEDGIYPKDEILEVSRELDDIISYYYKNALEND